MNQLPFFRPPQILAHRMLVMGYPENTCLSLEQACNLKINWVEFDVKVLADGEMISLHDGTLDRTTNGTGDVTKLTLREVKELDAGKGYNFHKVEIPTIEEIFQTINRCSETIFAEMHIHNLWEPEKLVPLLDKYNLRKRCYFNLNSAVVAEYFRNDVEDKESLISLNVSADTPELKDLCNELDLSYLCVSVNALNENFVKKIHSFREENSVFVHCFPVQTEDKWKAMIDMGVDVIQTDFPEALIEFMEENVNK